MNNSKKGNFVEDPNKPQSVRIQNPNMVAIAPWLLLVMLILCGVLFAKTNSKLGLAVGESANLRKELTDTKSKLDAPKREMQAMIGTWRCQTTIAGSVPPGLFEIAPKTTAIPVEMTLDLIGNGQARFVAKQNNSVVEDVEGPSHLADKYLIIDKTDGGYASFKVVSHAETEMTLISRNGQILKFTRLK